MAICAIICLYVTAFSKDFQASNIIHFKNNHQFTEI